MAQYVSHWEAATITGPAVAIDVVRAFTTAAYAFAAGAREIHLVETVREAHALLDRHPDWFAMGEDRGLRPPRFTLSNSPVHASRADLGGLTIVQRTSAGTRGALAARHAEPLLCASLVVASATAAYLNATARDATPAYVITGRFADQPDVSGDEDLAAAEHIELLRLAGRGKPLTVDLAESGRDAAHRVATSPDAIHTLTLGGEHVHPDDISYCVDIDRFDFVMVARRTPHGLALCAIRT